MESIGAGAEGRRLHSAAWRSHCVAWRSACESAVSTSIGCRDSSTLGMRCAPWHSHCGTQQRIAARHDVREARPSRRCLAHTSQNRQAHVAAASRCSGLRGPRSGHRIQVSELAERRAWSLGVPPRSGDTTPSQPALGCWRSLAGCSGFLSLSAARIGGLVASATAVTRRLSSPFRQRLGGLPEDFRKITDFLKPAI